MKNEDRFSENRMNSPKKEKTPPARWYLYMLKCSDGTFYTGVTNNVERRLREHNSGTASRYTRSRLPVKLVHQERCVNKSNALKKVFGIKALSRKEKEEYLRSRTQ